jgi:hypothetical protein
MTDNLGFMMLLHISSDNQLIEKMNRFCENLSFIWIDIYI